MQAASQLRVEDLLSQLPGAIRRGHVPVAPEWEGKGGRLPTGYPEVDDLLGGGLPRGRLSELVGRGTFGATSLAQRLLAGVTTEANFVAWIDVADTFDPASASAAGITLHRLLWVRPPDLVAAFAATEILLATGGFALVLLDTAGGYGGPAGERRGEGQGERQGARGGRGAAGVQDRRGSNGSTARRNTRSQPGSQKGRRMLTAPQTWLRLARAAEQSRTALVVIPGSHDSHGSRDSDDSVGGGGLAGAAAGVRLELSSGEAVWEGAPGAPSLLEGLVSQVDVTRNRGPQSSPLHSNRSRSRQARIRLA